MKKVSLKEKSFFKVVGNKPSLLDYVANSPPTRAPTDWSGCYLQLNIAHAVETVPYRWDQGYKEVVLLEVCISSPIDAIVISDPCMGRPDLSGEEKARFVKVGSPFWAWDSLLFVGFDFHSCQSHPLPKGVCGIPEGELLMSSLKCPLICLETPEEWEMVVNPGILPEMIVSERVLYRFKPNAFNVTGSYRKEGSGDEWLPFPSNQQLHGVVNVPPDWFLQLL